MTQTRDGREVEDIRERAFAFAVRVVKLCQHLDEKPGAGRVLAKQLLRAGTSSGANLEEARGGESRPDFISKNAIALKEAREAVYWLRLLAAADVLPESRVADLRQEADQLARIIAAIIVSAKR
jgi:four helix bundle protein